MPDQSEFINYYIQSLQNELEETTKLKVMGLAKEAFKDVELADLKDQLTKAQEEIDQQKLENQKDQEQIMVDSTQKINHQHDKALQLSAKIDSMHRELKDKEAIIANLNEQISGTKSRRKKSVSSTKKKETAQMVRI